MTAIRVPPRRGEPPLVSSQPHEQVTQTAPPQLQERLFERVAALPEVEVGQSFDAVAGTRAFHLSPLRARGPADAFLQGTEFAHLHPGYDGSLHMALPPGLRQAVLSAGWGQLNPDTGSLLVYGPRDEPELEVVWTLLHSSFRYALDGATDRVG